MKWFGLIVPAIVLYLIVAVFVSFPGRGETVLSTAAAGGVDAFANAAAGNGHASLAGLPYRAVTMQIQRPDWMEKYKQSIDEIAAIGADTVKFVVDARQENGSSSHIYLDLRMTPSVETLKGLILYAKKKDLRVILMPIVLLDVPRDNEWRGTIKPESWTEWWGSYRDMLTHFSYIAQETGVDVLVVGSELVSTESNVKEWTKTIRAVRTIFKGKLTYSSNWDHYTAVKIWDQLDLIGMNSYWKMTDDDKVGNAVTLEEIKHHWKDVIQPDLLDFVKQTGKPLLFLEIGWFSQNNTAKEPWDYTKPTDEAPIDLQLQKRLYEGFFESWYGNPLLGGYSIWEWPPDAGGPDDKGYTPKGKPAEEVLKQWLAKPRWEVQVK